MSKLKKFSMQEAFDEIHRINQNIEKNQNILKTILYSDGKKEEYIYMLNNIVEDNNRVKDIRLAMQIVNNKNSIPYKDKDYKVFELINYKDKLSYELKTKRNFVNSLYDESINNNELNKVSIILGEEIYKLSTIIREIHNILNKFNNCTYIYLNLKE